MTREGARGAAASGLSRGRVLAIAAGVTATIVAWGLLVLAAIDFGREARSGDAGDWAFLAVATVGAIACMFLAIVLAARLQVELRTARPVAPPVAPSVAPPIAPPVAPPAPPPAAPVNRMTPGRHRS